MVARRYVGISRVGVRWGSAGVGGRPSESGSNRCCRVLGMRPGRGGCSWCRRGRQWCFLTG